jgi:hypothetical protein
VKLARRTSGKESLSWPTVTANEDSYRIGGESQQSKCLSAMARRGEMDENWSTPNCTDGKTGSTTTQGRSLVADIQLHGQAAPASSSSLGSRQGLWPTASVPNGGQTTSGRADKDSKKQVRLEHAVAQWGTPAANDANKTPHCEVNSNQAGLAKSVGLELQRQWGTPTARDHKSGRGNEEREYKELTPMVERTQAGKLNQNWVCCLMGVPMGWVDPMCPVSVIKSWPRFVIGWLRAQTAPIPCDSSAMESCLPPQSELSEFSLAS